MYGGLQPLCCDETGPFDTTSEGFFAVPPHLGGNGPTNSSKNLPSDNVQSSYAEP